MNTQHVSIVFDAARAGISGPGLWRCATFISRPAADEYARTDPRNTLYVRTVPADPSDLDLARS